MNDQIKETSDRPGNRISNTLKSTYTVFNPANENGCNVISKLGKIISIHFIFLLMFYRTNYSPNNNNSQRDRNNWNEYWCKIPNKALYISDR